MTNCFTALFGGTFDPIHNGHLLPAAALAQEVRIEKIYLLPNYIPPHKQQPQASTTQRLTMLTLAIENNPLFAIDDREIASLTQNKPSYTIDTLKAWRHENDIRKSLAFIIGYDSFYNLPTWKDWQQLLDHCHILVCNRTGFEQSKLDKRLTQWAAKHQTTCVDDLHHHANGFIYFANTPLENISATDIRNLITNNQDYNDLLPSKVRQYIQSQHLYGA